MMLHDDAFILEDGEHDPPGATARSRRERTAPAVPSVVVVGGVGSIDRSLGRRPSSRALCGGAAVASRLAQPHATDSTRATSDAAARRGSAEGRACGGGGQSAPAVVSRGSRACPPSPVSGPGASLRVVARCSQFAVRGGGVRVGTMMVNCTFLRSSSRPAIRWQTAGPPRVAERFCCFTKTIRTRPG